MIVKAFDWQIRHINNYVVIDLLGDIDSTAADGLRRAFTEAINRNTDSGGILLNFSKAGYINSSGIASIIRILTQALKIPTQLAACGLTKHYQNVFRITRLSDFIQIFNDEDNAACKLVDNNVGG